MSAENDQIIPVKVKYIEAQSAIILRNEKIRPSTPPLKIQEPRRQNGEARLLQNGVCRSPVDAENIEITHSSPVMTPCTSSPTNPLVPNRFQFDPSLTYAEKVAHEMIVTEKIYLDNLKQIIDGFLGPVANDPDLDVSKENIDDLFINVEEIYHFNWVLLQNMEKCNFDPVKLAECFVVKQVGFEIYTKYCTHYPRSMEVLLEWNQREDTANFIKKQQESLGHTLPLCSFLLKPVQRILKYHLLLGNIAKHFKQSEDEEGYKIIQKALSAMTNVAKHINDMKRKHEDAVHLQEIQSVLLDYEGPNLTSYGSIVLEDTFRLHGTKTGRYLLLFEKALLITKRRSDGTFSWKATVMYSNMMLADSVFREPLTFQVIPFDDRKICYTFVSRDLDTKQVWLLELKRRLLDSYAAAVPMKAKQIILGNSREDNEKENDEPENTRRLSTRKGANLQRHLSKENSAQFSKPSKNADPERRKYKDTDEATEEKTKTSMDSIKSPLRRKLRVFKKRRFTKESGKSSKRVSWSSDDNNDESYPCKEKRVSSNKQNKIQERKVSDNEPCEAIPEKENIAEPEMHRENNENEVSISSLLRDGKTMVSVTGEVDNHLSGHVKLRNGHHDALPSKKRRLAKGKRQKCKSMPAGEFPAMNEDGALLSIDKTESTLTRTQSLSRLYEKFLENELIDTPTSIKELQKYGLVNVRENSAKTKRLGSYDEQLASEEGLIHRSPDMGDVISAQTDDVMSNTDQSVHQTMKRVSMAFSDISPNFSPQKSPASSLDDLTNEDMTEDLTAGDLTTEDLTAGDLTPDEYTAGDLTPEDDTAGDLTPEEFTAGDLSYDESGTGSSLPNIMVSGEGPNLVGYGDESVCNVDKDRNEDSGLECKVCMKNGVTTKWNQNATTDNTYSQDSLYEEQSNPERRSTVHSEASSYVDTLSDDSCDEHVERLWLNNSRRSYERVFSLRRSYSEENLVSKYPLEEKQAENDPSVVASKSCTQFNHAPVMRSKSADCSKLAPQRESRPFTFSVTPKKKIVIKDSLWETIKEDAETNHHEILVGKDVHVLRRRKKRKSGHKKSKKNRSQSSEGRVENTQHVVRTCAVLNMGDYRATTNDANEINSARNSMEEKDLKTKTRDRGEKNAMSGSQKNIEKKSYSTLPNLSEKTDSNIVRSDSQNNTGNNCGNITLASLTETEKNSNAMTSHKVEETANHQHPPVTKIAVALRKKGHRSARKKSLVRVDGNVSEVPSTINYLCIETFPSDRAASAEREPETSTRDVKQTNGNAASRVERLSKYFNEVTTENYKHSGKYDVYKPVERLRKGSSIKKRVEELSRREDNSQKSRKNSEGKLTIEAELYSLQNAPDRIGFRRRSTSDEAHAKTRIELTSSLNNDKPNVQQLKNRLEEQDSGQNEDSKSLDDNNGLAKKTSTSLRIRDRIQELGQNPDKNPERNADDDLRSCRRLKERIERLQKGAKRAEVDSKRDITISDDTSETSSEPQQNEELRTVVIKRGWVQQFIQRIETGS